MGLATGGFGPLAVVDARSARPCPRRLVVRAGGGGPGRVRDRLVRAAGPGCGPARAAAARPRRHRRRRHGGGHDRPPPGPGGVRHRQPGQAPAAAVDGLRRGSHRLLPRRRLRRQVPGGDRRGRRRHRPERPRRGADRRLPAAAGPAAGRSWRWARPTCATRPAWCRTTPGRLTGPSTCPTPARSAPGRSWPAVTALLAAGELTASPVRAWDIRRAPEAFRFMSQARHTGKLVLTVPADPAAPRQAGTVLVTGGTGTLGAPRRPAPRRHRAGPGGAAHLPRRARPHRARPGWPPRSPASGAQVTVAACDAADRDALEQLHPAEVPLTGVVHAAGVLDDGIIGSLTPARVGRGDAGQGRLGLEPARAHRGPGPATRSCCSPRSPGCSARPGRATTRPPTPSWMPSPPGAGPRACRRCRWPGACGRTPAAG